MYELSRVRLYSIGPAGARYADTVLDLRGVGEPVPQPAPAQAEFFEDEPTGPPRRPAPAGVLFLENGGGKSVLLKLIFSVMLPGHRNTLGGASSGVLRKFLLADDCGHVALEWQHTITGELVVVGKVSEWRGRQVSSDPRKFAEAWYSFRPGPGLSLDSLPVAESTAVRPSAEGASGARGRRRTMKGFRDAITDAGKYYPHLDVVWVEIHDRWNEHLGELGLDPELFRYQREMNADEGEAAGLFAVKKDSDFTDLLLRAVTDTRDTDGLADLVHGFAGKLGRRAELTAERDFTAGSLELLERIVDTTAAREQARGIHTQSERRTRGLARRLSARGHQERGRATELANTLAHAAREVTDAEQARGRSAQVAAELAYRHASLALAAAGKGSAGLRRELTEARTLQSAWQAAETVLRHRAAADRLSRVTTAIREAERDAAPALAARTKAAGDLVRALHSAADNADQQADAEEERSAGLQAQSEAAHRDATAAATEAQRARSETGHLGQRLAEVEQETAEAVRAGWLDDSAPDADPARAALEASDAERTATAAVHTAREAARRAADTAREAAAADSRAELAAARASDALAAAETAHSAESRVADALAAEPRLAGLLSLPAPPTSPSDPIPAPRGASAADHPRRARLTVRIGDEPPGPPRAVPAEQYRPDRVSASTTGDAAAGPASPDGVGIAPDSGTPVPDDEACGPDGFDGPAAPAAADRHDSERAPGGPGRRIPPPPQSGVKALADDAGEAPLPARRQPAPPDSPAPAQPAEARRRSAAVAHSAQPAGAGAPDAGGATDAVRRGPVPPDRSRSAPPAEIPGGGATGAVVTSPDTSPLSPPADAGGRGRAVPDRPRASAGAGAPGGDTADGAAPAGIGHSPESEDAGGGASAVPSSPRGRVTPPQQPVTAAVPRDPATPDGSPSATGTAGRASYRQLPGENRQKSAGSVGGPLTAAELDAFAEPLRELLEGAVASAERQLFDLRTAAADDARILAALGDGGLLPPGPDVLATVEYLGEHGIPALPGWRYLAQAVDPADHAAVLAARPELVDGVVVTDPGTHRRAREVLAQAALLPRSTVAVGTAAALLAPAPAAGAEPEVFLVPPNPAMHDEQAADGERQGLRARATAREEEIRALAARLAHDRTLAARLESWRAGCPQGRLRELAEAVEAAREAAGAAREELTAARTARVEADDLAAEAARLRDQRQEAAQLARRAADALAGLAFRLRERANWQRRLRELAEDAAEAEARAEMCLALARAADEDRRAAQRGADDARRTARVLRAERSEIAGAPDGAADAVADPGAGSLPALREAYRAASQVYEKVGVGADLRAEQARAESTEHSALAELERLTNKVRTRAALLLEGTDGADGPSRQAAAGRAEQLVQTIESRASAASERLGRLRAEVERHAPAHGEAHTELPDDLLPRDAEHAQELLRGANAELAVRTEALEQARSEHAGLVRAHHMAADAAGGFDETAALLRDLLRDRDRQPEEAEPDPEPYSGSLEEARTAAAEARRSLRGCAADLSSAETRLREASDVLVRHANSARYEQVKTPARQQIRELPAAALPEHAAAWAAAFAPRLRVLTDELAQLERNRDSIVDRLRGLVESSLTTLRSAQRLSRLPEGLGEWSGQEFLRIRFDDPDHAMLTDRLGEVIDEATRAAVRKNSDLRRDGMSLLLRAVGAALQPKGIAVEILKPDAVLRAERVPVGQMGDVFSGGQLLTAAIALYCTMAALRSNDRGRDRHRHAGTLFLDNPIGRANATYLLELQRAVADALGVQLIYTTGLFDTTALAEFPLVVRLRNDADLRAGLKYISVEEHLRPGLPAQDPEGEQVHGEITATRMFKRPAEQPL
ncbi:hypothetical protein [Actinacidiphila oryziradicis]|uniref:Chromosome segregation ATPase n=1 Tax=Actinacidiphila oryziradicis TaxID=2571141 RepID=A0A4U0SH54_9ACTN|nr:hypothetical protein [Actinacidiphila oryziradicis]TKA08852.1 hypothetical protein FCI23_26245 [Actinacidiphila oryziradicis]